MEEPTQAPADQSSEKSMPKGRMIEADVEALSMHLTTGGLLFDVRTPEEFAEGHVPGAKNLPLQELEERMSEIPRDQGEVFLICRSGARSARAGETLAAERYQVTNVAGGTLAWIEAGHSVE